MDKAKYENISYLINKYGEQFDVFPSFVKNSLNVFKSKKHFYDSSFLSRAAITLSVALDIISAPYYPLKLHFNGIVERPDINFNYKELKEKIFDSSYNIFLDYYKVKVDEIKSQNFDFIGIC